MRLIDQGMAPKIVQSEEGATYDAMLKKAIVGVSGFIATSTLEAMNFWFLDKLKFILFIEAIQS